MVVADEARTPVHPSSHRRRGAAALLKATIAVKNGIRCNKSDLRSDQVRATPLTSLQRGSSLLGTGNNVLSLREFLALRGHAAAFSRRHSGDDWLIV